MFQKVLGRLSALCILIGTVAGMATTASAITVAYSNKGDSVTSSLSLGGITVTGSANVVMLNFNGLGIVGGTDSAVDGDEFINFVFDVPVENVSYYVGSTSLDTGSTATLLGERELQAFGVGGSALGSVTQNNMGLFDVSTLFGDALIESFRLTSVPGASFRLTAVIYDIPALSTVPLPAALPLYGAGLAVMGLAGWRRKRKAAA